MKEKKKEAKQPRISHSISWFSWFISL